MVHKTKTSIEFYPESYRKYYCFSNILNSFLVDRDFYISFFCLKKVNCINRNKNNNKRNKNN